MLVAAKIYLCSLQISLVPKISRIFLLFLLHYSHKEFELYELEEYLIDHFCKLCLRTISALYPHKEIARKYYFILS